jgi:hypothetical protein
MSRRLHAALLHHGMMSLSGRIRIALVALRQQRPPGDTDGQWLGLAVLSARLRIAGCVGA